MGGGRLREIADFDRQICINEEVSGSDVCNKYTFVIDKTKCMCYLLEPCELKLVRRPALFKIRMSEGRRSLYKLVG